MKGNNANATKEKEVGRSEFGRQFAWGYLCVTVIAFRDEENGKIRLNIDVPNAQIFHLPCDLMALIQVIGWGIATVCTEYKVMVFRRKFLGWWDDFSIWRGCCRVLNSLDSLVGPVLMD